MSLANDLLSIVGSPQWNFVYYNLLLVALMAAIGLALSYWRRSEKPAARRLLIGGIALLATRMAPVILSLTPALDYSAPAVLPPLERALDAIAIAITGWMFVIPLGASWAGLFLGLNVVLSVLADVGLTRFWIQDLAALPTLSYGMSWQRYVWGGWQIALCLFLGYLAWRRRSENRLPGFLISLFFILLVGQVLELVVPIAPALFPIWERSTVFVATLLMTAVVYAATTADLSDPASAPLPPASQAGTLTETLLTFLNEGQGVAGKIVDRPDAPADPVLALRAAHVIAEDRGDTAPGEAQRVLAGRVARLLARALDAEQAAIGLLEGAQEDRMHLAAVHNPRRRGRGEIVSFPLDEQLAIRRALRRRELVQADGAEDIIQIKFLYALMGSEETGPILIQPLVYRDRPVGAIIAGNGSAKRPFSAAAVRLAPLLAEAVALAVVAPRAAEQIEDKLRQTQQTTSERDADWYRRLDILANDLQRERENARLFGQRMAELEREVQQKQADLERQTRRQTQLEDDIRRKQEENAAINKKLDSLTLAKVVLEDEIQGYRDQVQNLEHLLAERS
jgi:GAF domain-containing protein